MTAPFEILFDPKRKTQCGLLIHAWKGADYWFPEGSEFEGQMVERHNIYCHCKVNGQRYDFARIYKEKPNFRTYIDFIKLARIAKERTMNESIDS